MDMKVFNIDYVFDRKNNSKSKGLGAVEIRITFSRTSRILIATGVKVSPEQWDEETSMVIGNGAKRMNRELYDQEQGFRELLADMERSGEPMTAETFRRFRDQRNKMHNQLFYDFAMDAMAERNITDSTRVTHMCAIEALKKSGCVRMVSDLTADNIARFDRWLRERNPHMMQTTLHNYHKRIKVYANEAVRRGLLNMSPYERFKDQRGRPRDRVFLTDEELTRIRKLKIYDKPTGRARDVFVFCCYTGLAYADVNYLASDMVIDRNGHLFISAERHKTGTRYYTPMLPPAQRVWKKYKGKLPVYSQQSYNRLLKILGHMAGINKPMSSHIARHTFATTVVLANDIPIETLSKMLGHRDIRVTQVYARVLDQTINRHSDKLFQIYDA